MSAKLNLYKDFLVAVKAIPEIQTVGLWNSQFDEENERQLAQVNFPAVYIEYASIPWTQTLQQAQNQSTGVQPVAKEQDAKGVIITIHQGFSKLEDVDVSYAKIETVINKVYFALQDLAGDEYERLHRIAERQDINHGRIIDWQTDFTTQLQQLGEEKGLIEILADVLAIEQNKDLRVESTTTSGVRTDKSLS